MTASENNTTEKKAETVFTNGLQKVTLYGNAFDIILSSSGTVVD